MLWITRDKDGSLRMYLEKPYKDVDRYRSNGSGCKLPNELFPDLKYEDGPVEVSLETTVKKESVDYLQVIKQTDEEKLEMYMEKCTKEDLARMLIQANKEIEMMEKAFNRYSGTSRTR